MLDDLDLDDSSLRMLTFLTAIMCLIVGTFIISRMIYDPDMQRDTPALAGHAPTLLRKEASDE